MNFNKLIDSYLASLAKTRSHATIKNQRKRLNLFLKYLNWYSVSDLGTTEITGFHNYVMNRKKITLNTRYVYISAAKQFLSWLHKQGHVPADLSGHLDLPKWMRKPSAVGSQQSAKNNADLLQLRDNCITALYLNEHIPLAQIDNLTTFDYDDETAELRIIQQKTFQKLSESTTAAIKKYLTGRNQLIPKSEYLFLNYTGTKLAYHTLWEIVAQSRNDCPRSNVHSPRSNTK